MSELDEKISPMVDINNVPATQPLHEVQVKPEVNGKLSPMPETMTAAEALEYLRSEAIPNNHAYFLQIRRPRTDAKALQQKDVLYQTTTFSRSDFVNPTKVSMVIDELTRGSFDLSLWVNTESDDSEVNFAAPVGNDPRQGYKDSQGNMYKKASIPINTNEAVKEAMGYALTGKWEDFKKNILLKKEPAKEVQTWLAARGKKVTELDAKLLPEILLKEQAKIDSGVAALINGISESQVAEIDRKFGSVEDWRVMVLRGLENLSSKK